MTLFGNDEPQPIEQKRKLEEEDDFETPQGVSYQIQSLPVLEIMNGDFQLRASGFNDSDARKNFLLVVETWKQLNLKSRPSGTG